MSKQSIAGRRAWQRRAPEYTSELRADIDQRAARPEMERRAAARFAGWEARGGLPLWLRVKQRLHGMFVSVRAAGRS
jgi:hypothetical protein